jgi:hypothetical protein
MARSIDSVLSGVVARSVYLELSRYLARSIRLVLSGSVASQIIRSTTATQALHDIARLGQIQVSPVRADFDDAWAALIVSDPAQGGTGGSLETTSSPATPAMLALGFQAKGA